MWIGNISERPYIRFIDGSFARAATSNQTGEAVSDSVGMFLPGVENDARYDDIPSPWTQIGTQRKNLPVLENVDEQTLLAELAALQKANMEGKAA